MKRGQIGIGLVLLGIVAIIAVIGLVLLFTRASAEGASVGNSYGSGQTPWGYGIGEETQVPPYSPNRPYLDKPYYGKAGYTTQGSRTPAFVIAPLGKGGYASLDEIHACYNDLVFKLSMGTNLFDSYQVPEETSMSPAARGMFYGDSSAQSRINAGNPWGNIGGMTLVYAGSTGAEQQVSDADEQVREKIVSAIRYNKGKLGAHDWGVVEINGKDVAACYIGSIVFPFDQGRRPGYV